MNSRRRLGVLAAFAVASLSGCTTEVPLDEFGKPPQAFVAPTQALIPPPPFPTAATVHQSPGEFNGKFVALNYLLGDEIVTSGLGASFPPGLVVGKVTQVARDDGMFQKIEVDPAVDVSRVRAVEVLLAPPPPPDPDAKQKKRSELAFGGATL